MTIKITDIFNKQRELMEKYEHIEADNGFRQPFAIPVDINFNHDQARLKDFAWRITEEMAEAIEQLLSGNWDAAREELADVLHFMSELTILLGREELIEDLVNDFAKSKPSRMFEPLTQYGLITYHLSMTMHELKNKPWKQSHRPTNEEKFDEYYKLFWNNYLDLCINVGMNIPQLFEEYMKKHQVNVDRQKSGY